VSAGGDELLSQALRAQQAGQSAVAAALCRQVLAATPRQPQASLLLGLILGRDDADAGAPLLADYLAQFPDDAVAAMNLGMLRQRQGDAAADADAGAGHECGLAGEPAHVLARTTAAGPLNVLPR
jgi:hypothetical protein